MEVRVCLRASTQELGDMCTYFLIIGGKSAILTAIAVALGGKATSTGRGTGLKSFIKEGESCVFSITFKHAFSDSLPFT